MEHEPQLESVTEELYAHPPTEFVARRDALVKQTRAAGDALLAKQIKALRRPSVGAWYLNASSRAGVGALQKLTDLGRQLREAQAAGDFASLRELAARRNPVVAAAVRDLVAELARLGTTATATGLDEVRSTLASALADPEVADLLTRGRLDRPHNYSGFGELSIAAGVSTMSPGKPSAPTAPEVDSVTARRDREQFEAEVAAAEAELQATVVKRVAAEDRVVAAMARLVALTAEVEEARGQLAAAEAEVVEVADREHLATDRVDLAREKLR